MDGINEVVEFIKTCDHIDIVNRRKNAKTRYRLGITVDDQEELIRSVCSKDYVKGPIEDEGEGYTGELYVFKKFSYNHWFYIKIKILRNLSTTKAISCHVAEFRFSQ